MRAEFGWNQSLFPAQSWAPLPTPAFVKAAIVGARC